MCFTNHEMGSTPALSHTFVEIDPEIISTVILLPWAESFKKGCCQLQAKVCAAGFISDDNSPSIFSDIKH